MAQRVGYFEDDVEYKEGPFVMVEASGWRIEVELKEHHCPVLPDTSIYKLLEANGYDPYKTNDTQKAEEKVDFLNRKVKEGIIMLEPGTKHWYCPEFSTVMGIDVTDLHKEE